MFEYAVVDCHRTIFSDIVEKSKSLLLWQCPAARFVERDADRLGLCEGGDVFIIVKPGETGEVEMTFPEDASLYTEVSCLLPGHYENGMTAPLTVEAN